MKKRIIVVLGIVLMLATVFTSCISNKKKVDNAKAEVAEAQKDLDKANAAYRADMASFRKETSEKIAANEKTILEFNAKMADKNEDTEMKYEQKIAELNLKNKEMKKKMDNYKEDGKMNWEKFKTEFSHDMDELGKAFKGIAIKNTN
ncbi:hypothetical protein [Emticicia fluvialis]|uniref:hypothetical protein n=1 Tax=Emticicia fluvialis TaxID=2974474 RepID=UPI002165126D|nr:hypothetical protein [Emticicia fluvialis]